LKNNLEESSKSTYKNPNSTASHRKNHSISMMSVNENKYNSSIRSKNIDLPVEMFLKRKETAVRNDKNDMELLTHKIKNQNLGKYINK